MKNLYRRYRPLKLDDVVGQSQVTDVLKKSLKQGKISHSYLLIGPRGCGKTSVARILAHEINGFSYDIEDDYIDIIEIDGASNRGIDNIRELREKVMIAPTTGKYKIYIIDEVHMLTKEAFNALLKTLEEPPAHAIFIMATTDAYKVPVTISSRSQTYVFKLASPETMFEFLSSVSNKEKINISDDALRLIAKRGGGSFRDSLSLLDQLSSLSNEEITKDMVISAMGLPQDELIAKLLDYYLAKDIINTTKMLRDLLSSGVKAETITEEIISSIVAEPRAEFLPLLAKLTDIKAPHAEARLLVALTSDMIDLASSIQKTPQKEERPIPGKNKNEDNLPKKKVSPSSPKYQKIDFNWNDYVAKVQGLSDAIYSQLKLTQYEFDGETLHIYPGKKITKNILSRSNNKKVLMDAIDDGIKVLIHDENDKPDAKKDDETLNKISAIMGGEVQNDGGNNPF